MTIYGFLLSVAYFPYWMNGVNVPRWAVVLAVTPILLFAIKTPLRPPPLLIAAFLLWGVITSFWSSYPQDAIVAVTALLALAVCAAVGASQGDLRSLFVGIAAGLVVNAAAVVAQLAGAWPFFEFSPPAGLFSNRSLLAELAALSLVAFIVYRIWWGVPFAAFILVCSWSRASLLTLVVVALFWLWTRRSVRSKLAVAACVVAALVAVPHVVQLKSASSWERFVIIKNTAMALAPWGYGAGSFAQDYPLISDHPTLEWRPTHAHMDFIEVAHDFGIPGLALLVAICVVALLRKRPERFIVAALITEGSFGLHPLFTPHGAAIAAMLAGLMLSNRGRVSAGSLSLGSAHVGRAAARGTGSVPAGGIYLPLLRSSEEGSCPRSCGLHHQWRRANRASAWDRRASAQERPKFVRPVDELGSYPFPTKITV